MTIFNLSKVQIDNVKILTSVHNSFDNIKDMASNSGIEVKESNDENLKNLYLLITDKNQSELSPLQLECNGLILEKETNKIVCMAQNKFIHINNNNDEQLLQIEDLKRKYKKFRMEYCEDGTVIRLYNYKDVWYTATTRCIDARKSYWSSNKTFDNMFWEIFNTSGYDLQQLDKSYTYLFILIHKENRIVVNHRYNNLIYISRINNETLEEDFKNYFYNEKPTHCIRRTKQITDSWRLPLDSYFLSSKRGVILKFLDKDKDGRDIWRVYQYDFNTYNKVKEIRGNIPLIRMRYLELLEYPDKLEILENNYPEHHMQFVMIKHSMNKLYREIHNLYYQSHIKHAVVVEMTHKLYKTLQQLHGQYKKQGTVITLDEVIKKVNSLDKNVIKKLIGWV
jgi:hypothetical protein